MTLLRKFGILIAVLGLVVVLNLSSAVWAVTLLEREVTGYLQSISTSLGGLNRVKRNLGEVAHLLPGGGQTEAEPWATEDGPSAAPPHELLARHRASILAELKNLNTAGSVRIRAGISTQFNLESRIAGAFTHAQAYLQTSDADEGLAARRGLFALHELIERTEAKILGDARHAVVHGRVVRGRVLIVMFIALALAVGVATLGLILMNRWVVRPVDELRIAADRIAQGDYAHRVPVAGRDELAQLSSEVNHMAGMISSMQEERVERERLAAIGEMVRRLAHNLRNPLAGIRSLAELSKGDLPPDSPVQENQDRIVATVDRFEQWLAEMLKATTPLKVEPRPTDIGPWLARVVEPLRPMAAAKGVALDLDLSQSPQAAPFDPGHLEHAVVALITNAIQASPKGARVLVAAQTHNGQAWDLRVEDRGPGVAPDLAEKIFRPYFTTKRDGTGIGLAVVRQVVDQHAGKVWVEPAQTGPAAPQSGPGARFVLRLPLTDRSGGVQN